MRFIGRLGELEQLRRIVRQKLSAVDQQISAINQMIANLPASGFGETKAVLGDVVFDRASDNDGSHERHVVFHAAILLPYGVGACLWSTDEFATLTRCLGGREREVTLDFIRYEDCDSDMKTLLLPQVAPLLQQLMEHAQFPMINN